MKNKVFITTLLLLLLVLNIRAQCTDLIFSDEFSGNSVDQSKWRFDIGDGCPSLCGWGNAEEQYYRAENTSLSNGKLIITTKNESFGGKQYTSSKLTTSQKFNSRYGRYEASIKLPSAGGIWPAFWMLPENGNWPFTGEIDIMEAQHKNPEKVGGTVHYSNGGWRFNGREYSAGLDLSAGFHQYAVEWEPNEIRWYVDNQLYHTVTPANTVDPWPFSQGDWYIILNVAVGGPGTPYTGNIQPTPSDYPTQMEVDYVRVYNGTLSQELTGDNRVETGTSNKRYTVTPSDNTSYSWTVPNGATITSGQSTNSITVDWGTSGGNVFVQINTPGCDQNTLEMNVEVIPKRSLDFVYEDFDANRNISYTSVTDGILNQSVTNPGPNSINTSQLVGKYQRSSGAIYDGLYISSSNIGNASELVSGKKEIWVDVYSNAPIGTEFMLQIENSSASTNTYPAGRHSRYIARTNTTNEWETLEFELLDRPDTNVNASETDQFVVLIDSNSNTDHIVYFDNFRKMQVPEAILLEEEIISNYEDIDQLTVFFENGEYSPKIPNPNPNNVNASSNVASYTRSATELYDVVSFSTNVIENSTPFVEGDNIFYLDLYTSAPIGTEITLSLENQVISENDFPFGRNSQYIGVVQAQNAWHTIEFAYASSPDVATSGVAVDEISILFNPNSNTSETYYIDNFRIGKTKLPANYNFLEMIQDFENVNNLVYNPTTTGTYEFAANNPSPNTINSSIKTGKYSRDISELYDVLFFDTSFINDASAYVAEEKRFAMDIYTSAPIGTIVSWQLEAGTLSTSENYPIGRHSIYQAKVEETNTWHTIEFVLTATPDLVVSDSQIDSVVFLFNPGIASGETFYMDNLRILKKEDVTKPNPVLSSIVLTPSATQITLGTTQQFSAQGYDQNGDPISAAYTWTTNGGSIDTNGLYTSSSVGGFSITATSGSISGTATIKVTNNTPISYTNIPGILEAEDYKPGGPGVGYNDSTPGNSGSAYNRQDDVDIETTGDETGLYNVGWIDADEWLAYDIKATEASNTYDIDFRVASPGGNGSFHLELDGSPITEVISTPNTGNWQNYQTVTAENILITSGTHEIRIVFDSPGLNINFIEFKKATNIPGGGIVCSGVAANGQYSYEISSDVINPTITFKPEVTGTGDTVCILYYGTSATGSYPGYIVSPNEAYQINASEGETIYFYYTYSLSTGGENNTANSRHNFVAGQCNALRVSKSKNDLKENVLVFPNPVLDKVQIQLSTTHNFNNLEIVDILGKIVLKQKINPKELNINLDIRNHEKGLFFLNLYGNSKKQSIKLMKK
ncbi:family 16 glycosylhydrolase [Aquimarina sp. 2304DJ70-9]|uniref:family 16 glycosylhydrolase n=1 Tax=Aquimarina penaris TaxID=3231044 RepID=UPI0034633940